MIQIEFYNTKGHRLEIPQEYTTFVIRDTEYYYSIILEEKDREGKTLLDFTNLLVEKMKIARYKLQMKVFGKKNTQKKEGE